MDAEALRRLDAVLESADPVKLKDLETKEFTSRIAKLYTEIDYVHPFGDGNSRTLREFTRQLAEKSGYDLNWNHFSSSPRGRDALYVARDRSVNEVALPRMQDEHAMRRVIATIDRLAKSKNLAELLPDVITRREP
jgi:cell filamentation protein